MYHRHITPLLAVFILVFSTVAILFNDLSTHYIGNRYVPYEMYYLFVPLCLMWWGARLLTTPKSYVTQVLEETIKLYALLSLMAYLTTAVQYTPFKPIDAFLIQLDAVFYFNTAKILNMLYQFGALIKLLHLSYALLNWELLLIFCLIVLSPHKARNQDFYFLMLFTGAIGFVFYYFFPTTAPASVIQNHHFLKAQYDTGQKFFEIHDHLPPTTLEGGLIAMPSFHSIWALIILYYVKPWPLIWYCLLPLNGLIIAACVLLGWHYLVDIIAALLLFFLSVVVLWYEKRPFLHRYKSI